MPNHVLHELLGLRDSDNHICIHDLPEEFKCVEEGEWTQEHKSQSAEHIVKHVASERHFCLNQVRYGSYHSGWDYYETGVTEVKQVTETVVVTKWVTA